jgi:hypothetical protein
VPGLGYGAGLLKVESADTRFIEHEGAKSGGPLVYQICTLGLPCKWPLEK